MTTPSAAGALRARGGVEVTDSNGKRRVLFFNLNALAALSETLSDAFDVRNAERLAAIRAITDPAERDRAIASYERDRAAVCDEEGVLQQLAFRTAGRLLRVVVWAGLLHEGRAGWSLKAAGAEFDKTPELGFAALLAMQRARLTPEDFALVAEEMNRASDELRDEAVQAAAAVLRDPLLFAASAGIASGKPEQPSA
jgi:hypothetical protein